MLRQAQECGSRIAAVEPMIDHSLKLTKVDKVIEIFPTVDQAAKGFSGREPGAVHSSESC